MPSILVVTLPLLLLASPEEKKEQPPADAVTPHGEDVPTVAPGATDNLAPVLAPEKKPEVGNTVVTEPHLSVYEVDLPLEATITGASFGLFVFIDLLIKPTLEGDVSCRQPVGNGRCNPSDLSSFDRYAVGRKSAEWQTFSDIAVAASILAPALYLALESIVLPTKTPWTDFLGDMLVIGESIAVTTALQSLLKFTVRRPRPIRYSDLSDPFTPFDAELSFPSAHTMLVASATTAMTTTLFLRHPTSPMRWVALAGGVALSGLTALGRVQAGAHFPTDVIVGGFIGAFAGFAVPYLHRKKVPLIPTAGLTSGGGTIGLSGSF